MNNSFLLHAYQTCKNETHYLARYKQPCTYNWKNCCQIRRVIVDVSADSLSLFFVMGSICNFVKTRFSCAQCKVLFPLFLVLKTCTCLRIFIIYPIYSLYILVRYNSTALSFHIKNLECLKISVSFQQFNYFSSPTSFTRVMKMNRNTSPIQKKEQIRKKLR